MAEVEQQLWQSISYHPSAFTCTYAREMSLTDGILPMLAKLSLQPPVPDLQAPRHRSQALRNERLSD